MHYINFILTGCSVYFFINVGFQISTVRLLLRVSKYDYVTPLLKTLHLLPVQTHTDLKLSVISHNFSKNIISPMVCTHLRIFFFRLQPVLHHKDISSAVFPFYVDPIQRNKLQFYIRHIKSSTN